MVDYFLLTCELYDEERDKLRRKIGVQRMGTSTLFGGSTKGHSSSSKDDHDYTNRRSRRTTGDKEEENLK